MARKRRMKLPNGFGTIKYLGKNRRRPYAVYPPVSEYTEKGPVTPKALGYTETWEDGYELLTAYNMQLQGKIQTAPGVFIDHSPTFEEVYKDFYREKYESNHSKQYSYASMRSTQAAYKNCSTLHHIQVGRIKYNDLQKVINTCPLKHSSLELIVSLLHQMYAYMIKHEIVDKDHSTYLYIPIPDDDEQGEAFTDEELLTLWNNKQDPIVQKILIMCYSGFRITAYTDIEVNQKEQYFKGGLKTAAGKKRIVPIHSCIKDFVTDNGTAQNIFKCSPSDFREQMYNKLSVLNIATTENGKKHTPHDCRHTFSSLCERYGVNENDRKRMMGHSFGSDITNAKYGHRTVNDLRKEIEKIQIPKLEISDSLKICC